MLWVKGLVHFQNKKNNDNLLTPVPSKKLISFFFIQIEIKVFEESIPGFFSI